MWGLDWGPPLTNQRPGQDVSDQSEVSTKVQCLRCGEEGRGREGL